MEVKDIEDFILDYDSDVYCDGAEFSSSGYSYSLVKEIVLAFAKEHVKNALKEGYKNNYHGISEKDYLECYPLENIK